MIFQDPYSSLNSRIRIGSILSEPILFYRLAPTRSEAERDVAQLIEAVGLDADPADRYRARIFRRTKTAAVHCTGARRPSAPDRM